MSPFLRMFAQECSEEDLRVIGEGSFVPQRDHGVYAHGAARGQIRSNQTDRDHYCSGNDNRKRAGDWQVGYQAGGCAIPPARKRCSDSETSADRPQGVAKDYAYNVSPGCTERHANADLMCAPGDRPLPNSRRDLDSPMRDACCNAEAGSVFETLIAGAAPHRRPVSSAITPVYKDPCGRLPPRPGGISAPTSAARPRPKNNSRSRSHIRIDWLCCRS